MSPPAAKPGDGVAWVTGASMGLGAAVVARLVREGWTVVASARSQDKLEALAAAHPGKVIALACDVTDGDGVRATVETIRQAHGPLALAILNAGTYKPDTAHDFSLETLRAHIALNLEGTANCLTAILPGLLARKQGQIGVVASVAGYRGLPRSVSYSATKAGLIAMVESLKLDLDPANVKIQIINPGFVKTPLTDRNDFEMPMLMEADDAADQLVKGLARRDFEITFPLSFTWFLKRLRCLPYPLYFPLVKKITQG